MVLREELFDAQQPSESAMEELEFLSAHEALSQEHNEETSNPFPSSCSPIPQAAMDDTPQPTHHLQGSVRAMVQAMEQRQLRQSRSPPPAVVMAKPPTASTTLSTAESNNTMNEDSSKPAAEHSTADASLQGTNTSAESTEETVAVDHNDDNDDFWASEIIAENDTELFEARMEQEEAEEESRMRDEAHQEKVDISENQPQAEKEPPQERHINATPLQVTTNTVDSSTLSDTGFAPGTVVDVQARTWPGINQPGGVATILNKYHEDNLYDVQYVLDRRKEKKVESKYLSLHQETTPDGTRRRSPRVTTPTSAKDSTQNTGKPRSNLKKPPSRLKKRKSGEPAEPSKRQKSPRATLSCKFSATTTAGLCKKADQLYQQRIRSAIGKGVVYICASNLSDADEKALKELALLVKESNVRIVQQGNIQGNKTTMCVVPTSVPSSHQRINVTAALRTMKTMQAAVLGIPLVNTAWIYNCKRAKSLVEPDACLYIRSLPTKRTDAVADFGVSFLAAARLSLHCKYSPFAGLFFYFCGFKQKEEANFQELLRASGIDSILNKQTLLKHLEGEEPQQLVVVCGDATTIAFPKVVYELFQSNSDVVVASQWLVDSVSAGKALPVSDYPPISPKARILWETSKDRALCIC